jgi:hypothetical protein
MHRTSNGARPRFCSNRFHPDERVTVPNFPYRILCATGRVLGTVATLQEAIDAYNGWAQATAIVLGNYVVHQRKGGVR